MQIKLGRGIFKPFKKEPGNGEATDRLRRFLGLDPLPARVSSAGPAPRNGMRLPLELQALIQNRLTRDELIALAQTSRDQCEHVVGQPPLVAATRAMTTIRDLTTDMRTPGTALRDLRPELRKAVADLDMDTLANVARDVFERNVHGQRGLVYSQALGAIASALGPQSSSAC